MSDRMLLILDIDEALVHSDESPLDPNFDFRLFTYNVVKRPYLDEFIYCAFEYFDVAIWTAATDDYAQIMIEYLFPKYQELKFVWSRKRCLLKFDYERGDYFWIKDLKKIKKLGYNLEKVLVIEDEMRSMQRSFGNLILMKPFDGNTADDEFQLLIPYLEWISRQDNVRTIEKRFWRSFGKDRLLHAEKE